MALKNSVNDFDHKKIKIYTDSLYSINSVKKWIKEWKNNNWKNSKKQLVKNLDIIKPIDDIITKYGNRIEFIHVNSHQTGDKPEHIYNNMVDKLASTGALKYKNM